MAIGDIYRVLIVWHNDGSDEDLSTAIFGRQSGVLAPTISAMGDDVKAWWTGSQPGATTSGQSYFNGDITLERVTLRRFKPLEPVELVYTTGLPDAGGDTSDNGDPQASILTTYRTGKIGRSYRGRGYWPTPAEDNTNADGNLPDATASAWNAEIVILFAQLAIDGFVPVVYSRLLDSGEDITLVKTDARLRTQRRRTDRTPNYQT